MPDAPQAVRASRTKPASPASGHAVHLAWVVALRGFAALWVFSFHLWLALGGVTLTFGFADGFTYGLRSLFRAGYQGVDLFFVLSGFVIAWPYVSSGQLRMRWPQIADFYRRRYFRIAPLFYVTIAVMVVLIQLRWLQGTVTPRIVVAHLLFLENFVPEWVSSLRGVYWTLPTEIDFYLILPFILRYIDVERPWRFAAFWIVVAVGYRIGSVWSTQHALVWLTWTAAYLPGRIDQFACGMAAACALSASRASAHRTRLASVLGAGAIAVAGLVCIARYSVDLDAWFALGPSVAGVLIALFVLTLGRYAHGRHRDGASPRSAVARFATRLGEASFGIYLWHTVFIDLAVVGAGHFALTGVPRMLMLFTSVPVTLGVSLLGWHYIEAPCIEFARAWRWQRHRR